MEFCGCQYMRMGCAGDQHTVHTQIQRKSAVPTFLKIQHNIYYIKHLKKIKKKLFQNSLYPAPGIQSCSWVQEDLTLDSHYRQVLSYGRKIHLESIFSTSNKSHCKVEGCCENVKNKYMFLLKCSVGFIYIYIYIICFL